MENSTIFFAYLATWLGYLIAAFVFARRKKLHWGIVSMSHVAPSAVAALMIYVFLIKGGATVAQFVAGSESGMDMWFLWCDMWPCLLLLTAASALVHLVWAIIACVKKTQRKWIPIAVATLLMSVFAYYTVLTNFPDA